VALRKIAPGSPGRTIIGTAAPEVKASPLKFAFKGMAFMECRLATRTSIATTEGDLRKTKAPTMTSPLRVPEARLDRQPSTTRSDR